MQSVACAGKSVLSLQREKWEAFGLVPDWEETQWTQKTIAVARYIIEEMVSRMRVRGNSKLCGADNKKWAWMNRVSDLKYATKKKRKKK